MAESLATSSVPSPLTASFLSQRTPRLNVQRSLSTQRSLR